MATVLFDCVYTAQKTQKSKKYQDGRVKYNRDNHKVSLYDMEGNLLDSDFVSRSLVIENGTDLELEKYLVTIESDGNVQSAGNAANPPSEMSRPADTFEPVRGGIAQPRPEPTRGFSVQTADETPKKFSGNDIIAMLRKRRMEQQQCGPSIPQTSTNGTRLLGKTGVVGGASGLTPPSRAPILKRSPPSPLLFKRPKPNDDYGSDGEGDTAERERKAMRPSTFGARNTVVTGNGDGSEPRPFAQRKFGAFKPPTQTNLQNFSRLLAGNKDATSSQKLLRQRSPLFSQRSQQPSSFSSSPSPSPSSPSPLRPSSSSSPSSSSPSRRPLQPHPGQGGVSFPASLGELRFPTLDECAAYSSIPVEDLGDSFSTLSEYKKAFSAALCREIQVTINESVTRICGLISSRPSSSASSSSSRSPNASALIARKCGHKGMIVRTAKKAGPNQGRQFVKCDLGCFFWVDELSSGPGAPGASSSSTSSSPARHRSVFDGVGKDDEVYLRGQGVGLYLSCELSQRRTAQGRWRGPQSGSGSFVLGLPWKERASAYAKDDLWAVRVSGETLVFRSSFHGPTKSGEVELTPLSRRCFSVCGGGEYLPCQALHGPNLSTELAMLDNLLAAAPTTAPIVPFLVSPRGATAATTCGNPCESAADAETVAELVDGVVAERGLNADQERVVRECVRVALGVDPVPPVVLVHGVFGSGKSSVVAAVLTLIDALAARLDESDAAVETRVLFAAATNAAVDRVLLQLLREGFTSFLRVGSRRKIARELLPYSLHGMGSDDDDVGELREMLREAKSPEDRASIAAEIKEVAAGGMAHRRELLETVRVVGATSAACSFPVMDACHFRVVFLDECCQMVEPLSLLSLGNFGCERAILVGDPQQLRPVLASSLGLDSADAGTGTGTAPSEGLSRTLFARLVRCGVEPIMLRTQYRCHPAISAIASKLFYGGRLLDGVSREDRAPLVPGLPPVVLCHAERGKEEADGWGSFFNTQEALAVAALVKILCESYAILPEQVGVIALYKAQVTKITGYLEGAYPVQVSTVDAFQGAERDIIVLATSRTVRLGFSDSPKRLNVAITRARRHLIVMGSAPLLTSNSAWDTVLSTALSSPGGLQSCSRIISTGELELCSQSASEQPGPEPKSGHHPFKGRPSAVVVVPPGKKAIKSGAQKNDQREIPQRKDNDVSEDSKGASCDDDDDNDDFLDDLNIDEIFG